MKIQGFCAALFALALATNAVSDCPDGSGKCDVKDSAAMLQSRLNIEEQAAEDESQDVHGPRDILHDIFVDREAPTFELEKHGGQTGCPGGWVTGQAIGGSGFRQESVGKADSEDHCIEKVNAEHPDANGATVCMHNHCGGVRTCYADYGMTGTNLAHDGHYDHHETCFFQPQSLLQQIADGEMSGDDSAFIADETEIDEVADEVEEKDDAENYQVVEVKDACNPCDTACVARTSQETFAKCDVDQDNKLSAKEVQDCSVDETGESASGSQSKFVALGEIVSDAKAMEFISYYDEDKDGELTPDEWLKAEVPCEANFVEEGKVISEETVIAKCISNVVKKVFRSENFKCKKTTSTKACSLVQRTEDKNGQDPHDGPAGGLLEESRETQSRWGRRRRRWGGGRRRWFGKVVKTVVKAVTCVWQTVVSWVDCVRQVAVNVVNSAVAGFKDCWDNIRKAVGGAYMDLIKACTSVSACLKHLLKGPKALWDKIVALARAGIDKLLYSGPLGKGVQWISNVIKKVPPTVKEVGNIAKDVGMAISKFVLGAIKAIKELGNINMCATSGYGMWYFKPTDCGAFHYIGEIFKLHNFAKIPSLFAEGVKRFGQCVIKLGMLSLPSPFLDVKIKSWCVPTIIQPVIKGIVGTFRFVIAQIAAGIAGCKGSHANQPVCIMVEDMKKIGDKLKKLFSGSFLQKSAAVVGETLSGDKDQFAVSGGAEAKCLGGTDFQVTLGLSGGIEFPPWGDSLSIAITGAIGCRRNVLFGDLIIGLGGSLFIAGLNIKLPDMRKTSFCPPGVKVAFSIGTPSTDIVSWSGSFDITAAVEVLGLTVKIGIGFTVLPKPNYPTGFSIAPKIDVKCPFLLQDARAEGKELDTATASRCAFLLQQESRERELEDEVAKHDQTEDKVYTAVGVLIKQFVELPHEEYIQAGVITSALQEGASRMAGKSVETEGAEGFPIIPKSAMLSAGLGVNFCCTCGISGGQKPPDNVNTAQAAAAAASNAPLANGWASYGGDYGTATVVVAGSECVVEGLIRGSHWGHVATLPGGCRPKRRLIFNQNNHQYTSRVDVLTNGQVHWVSGGRSHSWLSLSGIAFPTSGESNLPLTHSWQSYGGSYGTASYKVIGQLCMVNGLVKHGGWGTVANLPGGCRPTKRVIFNLNNHAKTSRVDVLTNGQIHWCGGGRDHSWLSMSGISFATDTSIETALPLVNGWGGYGGSYGSPALSTSHGICSVNGLIRGSHWGHVATLPTSCRPNRRLIFNLNNHQYTSRVDVLTNGQIHWVSGGRSHSWLSLSGTIFQAAR